MHNEGETPDGGDLDQSKAKAGKSSENVSESLPPQPPRKKKDTEYQRLKKAFVLLTACSNQAMDDEYQHFGNIAAAKLRNYNDTVRYVIQNEIACLFLNANGFFFYINIVIILISTQITHLQSTSQVAHLTCTLKVSILLRTLLLHLFVLRALLCHHSVSTITHFCLKFSHRRHFASYDILRGRY